MPLDPDLTPTQRDIATHSGSHAALVAGPGTGKTRVMTNRVIHLVENLEVPSSRILAITFTRAATRELRSRVKSSLPDVQPPEITTLHGYALRLLLTLDPERLPDPVRVADDFDERKIIFPDLRRRLNLRNYKVAEEKLREMGAGWNTLEARDDSYFDRAPDPQFISALREHRAIYGYTLRAELVWELLKAIDEGQLIPTDLGIDHLLVDEFQDLNPCDLEVVRLIGEGTQEIFVAGDDDQSIYGFRHADPLAIGRFTDDYHPSVRLDLTGCYRCGSAILAYAEFVLAGNLERVQKRVTSVPEAGRGEIHVLRAGDQTDEVVNIAQIVLNIARNREWAYDQFLILMRNDYNSVLSRSIISALRDLRIPASDQQDPLQPLDTPDGRTILSILELAVDGNDQLAWRAVFENRRNRIGERTLLEIHSDAASQSDRFRDALDRRCQSDSRVSREFEKLTAVITEIRPRLTEIRTAISIISSRLSITPSNAFNSLIADTVADSGTEDTSVFLRIIRTDWRDQEDSEDGSVRIMTMHRAKGLEAKCVFIVSCDDQTIPGGNTIDEERRLLYVSLTRAKELLFVTWAVRREGGQQFTGARPGNPMRTLSTLLSDGPVRPVSIQQYVREFGR